MNARHILPFGLAASLTLAAGVALAAQNGDIGGSSTGSVSISATIPDLVRISGLTDISLGSFTGSGGLDGSDDVCVFTNTGGYLLTAAGSGTGNAFTLTDGEASVAYTVEWGTTATATSGTALTSGTAATISSGSFTNPTCGGSTNAIVLIDISEEALSAAPAGTYTGTLTLTLAPQ